MSAKNFQRLQDSNKTRTLIRLATVSQSTLIGPNRILWTLEKLNVGTALVLSTVWPLVLFSVAQVALVRLTTLISAYFIFNDRFGHVEKATELSDIIAGFFEQVRPTLLVTVCSMGR